MDELIVSSFLNVLCDKLVSAGIACLEKLAPYNEIGASEIEKLQQSLIQIQGLLVDAFQKEITNPSVKRWLNDLQHLAYDIDDVLDSLTTETMHPELSEEEETRPSKVRKIFSTFSRLNPLRSSELKNKFNDITTKLQDLVGDKATLSLIEKLETRKKNINRTLQTSVVDPSSIVGRQAEKEALVQQLLLLGDEPCDQNYSIIPIVGMGGVGKTTLARLLYDDKQVKDHFELKVWVCVSDEFHSFRISKEIFQYMAKKEFSDFNRLQEDLRDNVRGKKFLLVLDDVWSENREDWETLVKPFYTCAPGSKIIITTRKNNLLKNMGYNPLNLQLESLSYDDALSLFSLHALGVKNFDSHLSLKPHGEGIVEKCDGLPLALISLGTSLRTKEDENSWKGVLESEIWKLPVEGQIIQALRLSYDDLSAPLKQLFAYCSLFPKNFLFDKEELVLLWMAEGFLDLPTPSGSTKEHLGHEFFDELLSRSFFQYAPNNESLFVMHDLMNDLATFIANEFFIRLDNESEKNIRKEMLKKYRHMSFVREEFVSYKKFEAFERAKSLRTFLAKSVGTVESWGYFYLSSKILTYLFPRLPLLRVLSLSGFEISEVPESIGTLRHLRYLNLSRTAIKHLPETVCSLYNLQTLILYGCYKLMTLPNNFPKLKNLCHLDVRGVGLSFQMLSGIGELKSLQISLSKIIIESKSGFEIAQLKNLQNLCGKISIEGLEKVQNAIHAHEVNLSQKRLSELELVWSDELYDSQNQMLQKEVLNELKPCEDKLIQLNIISYGGLEFPNWVGDSLFLRLKHLVIRGCKRCTSLPPLAQLPSLKELFIEGLHRLEVVGLELLGIGRAFPSLEILSFKDMYGWKNWSMNCGVVFPCLRRLHIDDCPNLVDVTLESLPSLNDLRLYKCDGGVLRSLVEVASGVTKLDISSISGLNDVVWRGVIEYIGTVENLSICDCNEIRYCGNLLSLGKKEEENNCMSNLLTSLRILKVSNCNNIERCSCPDGIEELFIAFCSLITVVSFPEGGQEKLRSLEIQHCKKLLGREWGGLKMNDNRSNMPMLEYVYIRDWSNLKSITELNWLVHLSELRIQDCESLKSFPELSSLTSLKELEIKNCPSMDAPFPGWAWPPSLRSLRIGKLKKPISEWGPQIFPTSLMDLWLYGDDAVSSCSQFSHLFPSFLTSLYILKFKKLETFSLRLQHLQHLCFSDCPNLKKVSQPQYITSLQHLSFGDCPNMMDLPKMSLPSLLKLDILGSCQNLEKRWSKRGTYWHLISHIPYINISSET